MCEEELEMPCKFTFDEFYEMLKELVCDPEAREHLAKYDAEANAGRGQLDDSSTCSDLAGHSHTMFRVLSWSILAAHGYPSYSQMIQSTKNNFELRTKFMDVESDFRCIGQRLIRRTDGYLKWLQEPFQDEEYDIRDRSSVFRLLERWERKNRKFDVKLPFSLTGGGR